MPQERKSYWNYIAGLLLFGSNGIVASGIALDSYKIVYLHCIIGIAVLLLLFLLTRQKRNVKGYERDLCFLAISGAATGCFYMKRISRLAWGRHRFCATAALSL